MQLFYNPHIAETNTEFSFDREECRHIVKVLRKSEGDTIHITNGKGELFIAEIILADVKNCTAKIIDRQLQAPKTYYLHMVVAPTKTNDRYEWFLEKATEIGVDEITPVICDHSERKVIKTERYQKIIQSAMKQSLSYYMPILNDPTTFSDFIKKEVTGQKFIAHCEDSQKMSLKRVALADHKITILIGPEGDFSNEEIKLATKSGYTPISLGKNRLRTETAAIVACHTVSLINS